MEAHTDADARSDHMKIEMANHFDTNEADYRDADWCSIVYEDDEVVVIADHKGFEHSEWSDDFADEDFSGVMHTLARQLTDYSWSVHYPVVFDKLE